MVVFGLRLNVELTLVNADAVVEVVAICVVGGNVVVYSLCSLFSTLRRLRDSEIDFNKEIGKKNSDCIQSKRGTVCQNQYLSSRSPYLQRILLARRFCWKSY